MTQCVVICSQCVDKSGRAKRWPQNCEACANNCMTTHRNETGHTDLELRVVEEFTADDVTARINRRQAFWAARRGGWAG